MGLALVDGFPVDLLMPTRGGMRLRAQRPCTLRVPPVGGTIKSFIGSKLAEPIAAVQTFNARYITERA